MLAAALFLLLHSAPPVHALNAVMSVQQGSKIGLATPIAPNLAITALHVVDNGPSVRWTQGFTSGNATVVGTFPKRDLAVLRAEEGTSFPLTVAVAGDKAALFDEVFYVAPDWEGKKGMVRGEVSWRLPDDRFGILPYAWFGMSGGAVFNRKGELIGVMSQLSQGVVPQPLGPDVSSLAIAVAVDVKGVR